MKCARCWYGIENIGSTTSLGPVCERCHNILLNQAGNTAYNIISHVIERVEERFKNIKNVMYYPEIDRKSVVKMLRNTKCIVLLLGRRMNQMKDPLCKQKRIDKIWDDVEWLNWRISDVLTDRTRMLSIKERSKV